MKFFIQILILFITFSMQSQINTKDSIVQTVAYWLNNDVVKYDVDYEWISIKNSDTLKVIKKQNLLHIKVVDSTSVSYDVEWTYNKIDTDTIKESPSFKIKFRTDEMGAFKEWLNKEEVLKELKRNNYPDFLFAEKNIISKLLVLHITKPSNTIYDYLINYILADISSYHDYFGGAYSMTNYEWGNVEVENPITKKMMNYAVVVEVEEVFEEDDIYIISSTTNPNQDNFKGFMNDVFKFDVEKGDFSIEIYNRSLFHNSGWLVENLTKRTVSYKNETTIKKAFFSYHNED